ncbi:MAG TPA: AAA family ATPase [Aquella sp.]|nr:AAA family ATPase [Aquella sp.]
MVEYEDELPENTIGLIVQSRCGNMIKTVYDQLECPTLNDITLNYPNMQSSIEHLISLNDENVRKIIQQKGRLIIFNGPAGTGKTSMVKSIGLQWKEWADMIYVSDVDALLGDTEYMQMFITEARDISFGKVNVYILEDVDSFIDKESKLTGGNATARLLNVLDGILGNNLPAIFILTANEEDECIHEAFLRKGRCLEFLSFSPFSPSQARDWLIQRGILEPVLPKKPGKAKAGFATAGDSEVGIYSLADLYSILFTHESTK